MTITNTVALGLLLLLCAVSVAIFAGAGLILLASRLVLGKSGMLGSAAMAVVAAAVVNAALRFGLLALAVQVPVLAHFVSVLQIVQILLGALLTCVIYMLLLDPRPSFVQAFLILLIQSAIGLAVVVAAALLATGVFHATLPAFPALR
ncbi:hypothetical protein [Terricaulis sp.]|uniref:hypothetical protein n=1 Tax=Terricaulis sp. TaxID=2768686 RepID=UPI0037831035